MSLYGFADDSDKDLRSSGGGGGKFGLNQDIRMVGFHYEPNGGKDDSPGDCIQVEFKLNPEDERTQRIRYYPVTKVYGKSGQMEEGDEGFAEAQAKAVRQLNASIVHILGCFLDKEEIKDAFGSLNEKSTFVDFAQLAERILPRGYDKKPLDIFLQYQWNIKGTATRTYTEIPPNMKGGAWLAPHVKGNFEPVILEDGSMIYVDTLDKNNVHPFERSSSYMDSNWAKPQSEESGSSRKADMGGGSGNKADIAAAASQAGKTW